LALEKWRPLPNERKIHFDCCFFLLVFPWLRRGAEKGARGIMSFEPAAGVRQNLFAGQSALGRCTLAVRALVTRRPKHLVRAESFFGGGLVED